MFNDIGALEVITIAVLAVIVFGPEKLPKVIQDVSRFIRKIREFSDNAKEDIRSELGPDFKDFEFEDLNPKNFVRKQLMDNDDLGLKEIRGTFDLRQEMNDIADVVNGREGESDESETPAPAISAANGSSANGASVGGGSATPDLLKKSPTSPQTPDLLKKREKPDPVERPPFDADAT
ncbi:MULTISPECIES: sec-independent translocase [unclassified Streptomyces]|uniref:sec-independent translocase n=1 Tax=unclassified Streptomyces TaxID=2593676 RepID=UPI002E779B6B|nr:sec-independent translocase [Streptomyces sp. JV176]MEE1804378.1 sec-independent translocase [Streptomyces sp. JV176]